MEDVKEPILSLSKIFLQVSVSILVLMEDVKELKLFVKKYKKFNPVSILVLMEDVKEHIEQKESVIVQFMFQSLF